MILFSYQIALDETDWKNEKHNPYTITLVIFQFLERVS